MVSVHTSMHAKLNPLHLIVLYISIPSSLSSHMSRISVPDTSFQRLIIYQILFIFSSLEHCKLWK